MAQATVDSRAEYVLQRQSQLENDRSTYDSHCKEVAERVLPRQDEFLQKRTVEGDKRSEKIFDATALLALDRAASAIDSLISPQTQVYHRLEPEDERVADDRAVKLYLDEVTKLLFRMRYRPSANFASQAHECYVTQMAFGTMGMFTDDYVGIGTRYKSVALSDLYIAENHAGIVDYWHRKIRLSARAALQRWGGDKLPEAIIKANEKEPFRKFDFIHCVKPNEERKTGAKDYRGMPFSSYYVAYEGKKLIDVGGYRTAPYAVSRHVTSPNETYGRSPAMMVLPDIKMVNEMEKTIIRAAHKIVDPPLLLYGDGILSAFDARPNAMNYGGVDEQGRQLVHPMKTGSNLPIALEMTEQKRKVINDAFYVTLFQILVQNPQMTATEALIRAQEKGQLLAPTVGRTQSEFFGPIIDRELDIMSMSGRLPPMPAALKKTGGGLKVVYTSPLARLRRAEDGVAIMRTIEALAPIAQVQPDVYDRFDPDIVLEELAEINGVPERVLRSREEMLQRRADREQAAQAAQTLEGANVAANAAKNMAKAAETAGFVEPATA
jgi:hypothetical protein